MSRIVLHNAFGVALSGSDIYICGEELQGGFDKPCIWKNGVISWLPASHFSGQANGMAVSGSDVYAAGVEPVNNGFDGAFVWKNGVETALAPSFFLSAAYGIFVSKHQ